MYYLFNLFNDYIIPLFGFIYLFIFPNQMKNLMKTSFEILDVAKWFQPSKIIFLGCRQQFVLWYLFIYISNGSQKPIQMICLDIPVTQIALIIPIRSSIMGIPKKWKILFHEIVDFDIDYYFLYWNFDN
jgi:hypothetical protein